MQGFNASRAILGGLLATVVMTALAYMAPALGMPKMDFAALLGSIFAGELAAPFTAPWWTGMILHFVNGTIIFSLIYGYFIYPAISGPPWRRGAGWGIILWLLSQAIAMPLLGAGFFSARTEDPVLSVLANLLGHLVYGAILGAVAGVQAASDPKAAMIESREREHGAVDLR